MAENKKMTVEEYESKYVKRENTKTVKLFLNLLTGIVGLIIFTALFLVVMKCFEIHEYAGYGSILISVIVFIFLFIVPVAKIRKLEYFETNVRVKDISKARKHNKKLRKDISNKIIDFVDKADTVKWYDEQVVEKLRDAVQNNNDEEIKNNLKVLFSGSVKKTSKDIIKKASLKSALFTAVSQDSKLDTALVTTVNLSMIKDIVFLYGYRPSDAKLASILRSVIANALVSFGIQQSGVSKSIGNTVAKTIGSATKSIPILGSLIETTVDSSIQGITNATFTAIIGYQTLKYLEKEYKVSELLDGIELENDSDYSETITSLAKELKTKNA